MSLDDTSSELDARPSTGMHVFMLQLHKTSLFAMLTDPQFKIIVDHLHAVSIPNGALIVSENDNYTNLYILRKGRVHTYNATNGSELDEDVSAAGSMFNKAAFLLGSPSEKTIRAVEDVRLWKIARGDVLQLAESMPDLINGITGFATDAEEPQTPRKLYAWQSPNEVILVNQRKHWWVLVSSLLPWVLLLLLTLVVMVVMADFFSLLLRSTYCSSNRLGVCDVWCFI